LKKTIRRVDYFGRISLPREIRKNMNLNSGDLIEISINKRKISFKKHLLDTK